MQIFQSSISLPESSNRNRITICKTRHCTYLNLTKFHQNLTNGIGENAQTSWKWTDGWTPLTKTKCLPSIRRGRHKYFLYKGMSLYLYLFLNYYKAIVFGFRFQVSLLFFCSHLLNPLPNRQAIHVPHVQIIQIRLINFIIFKVLVKAILINLCELNILS